MLYAFELNPYNCVIWFTDVGDALVERLEMGRVYYHCSRFPMVHT